MMLAASLSRIFHAPIEMLSVRRVRARGLQLQSRRSGWPGPLTRRQAYISICPNRRCLRRYFGARNLFRFNAAYGRTLGCFADGEQMPDVTWTEVRAPLVA